MSQSLSAKWGETTPLSRITTLYFPVETPHARMTVTVMPRGAPRRIASPSRIPRKIRLGVIITNSIHQRVEEVAVVREFSGADFPPDGAA